MPRVTVHHLTRPHRLPLIEEEGLRTRADLSDRLGETGEFDAAAPGTYAHGKRVSAFLDLDFARTQVGEFGHGLVSWSLDPAKCLAAPRSLADDPAAYWSAAKPLTAWGDDAPEDLEVHTNRPVRAKYVRLHAPLVSDEDLGDYAPLVNAVADEDRLSAKALMHLAVIASADDFDSPAFLAACALAWRDSEDDPGIVRELMELDVDKVAAAALAEFGAEAPEATSQLREVLEETREWASAQGVNPGEALFARTALTLDQLEGVDLQLRED